MSKQDSRDEIGKAWDEYHGPITDEGGETYIPAPPPSFTRGFVDGFQCAENQARKALEGHPDSELWGEHGLIAATMRDNKTLCEFINRELKMTADDPRIEELKKILKL